MSSATPVAEWIGVAAERNGTVKVAPDLSVPGSAWVKGPDGSPLPGLGAVAEQEGRYVARLIAARIQGGPGPGRFSYRNLGTMATIGRSAAVADFGRFTMAGFVAWLLWGLVHIYLLIGFRNRIAVFLNWVWSWFTYGRGARLITGLDSGAPGASSPQAPTAMRRRSPTDIQGPDDGTTS